MWKHELKTQVINKKISSYIRVGRCQYDFYDLTMTQKYFTQNVLWNVVNMQNICRPPTL